ncbi:MAG: TonB-dependent receptor [Gammaproteobacteria bacterium]|nr:TonB-dependent receptor [Gammaproteobacteria bacterium]
MKSHLTKVALAVLSASAISIPAVAQENNQTEAENDIEVIQVKGILGSMKEAARLKKTDGRIVDAIVAEDIGKLPDNNIAEALSRITGVSVRSDFGVGEGVSIRGLSQNRVELNGRSTIGDGRGGVNLSDFPSSFLKTVEVVKSPTADTIEGALGGTVSMKTVRPLDLTEPTGAVSLDFEYADKTENVAPIFAGSYGSNWDLGTAGTVGAIVNYAYQDREIRKDLFMSRTLFNDNDVIVRDQNTVEQYTESRERSALNLSLQWAPESGNGMFYLDLASTQRSGAQEGTSIIGVAGSPVGGTVGADNQLNDFTLENEFAIPKTYSDFRETDSVSNAFGGEWYLTDSILISGEIAVASSDSERPDSEFTLRPIDREGFEADGTIGNYTYDQKVIQSGDQIPGIINLDGNVGFTDPNKLALRTFKSELRQTTNDETASRFDIVVDEPFGLDFVTQIKAGARFTTRDYQYSQYKEELKDLYKDPDTLIWVSDYNDEYAGSFSVVTQPNSFDQAGVTGGQNDLFTSFVYNNLADLDTVYGQLQNLLSGTSAATTGSLRDNQVEDEGQYREISEDTSAYYVSAYLDFDRVSAIVGGRYVSTDLESSIKVDGAKEKGTNDYDDFLPSLNVTYTVDDNTLVRFASAKVMRRADFGQLSPAFTVNNDATKATQGAIGLDPFRATQYDLSVEHYFGEANMVSFAVFYKDVESFLSSETVCVADDRTTNGQNVVEYYAVCLLDTAGVDNKTLEYNNISEAAVAALRDQGLTGIETTRDTNGESGYVQGFEIGYQQQFDFLPGIWSGLGVNANYTYADSEQPVEEGQDPRSLLEISEHTFNFQTYFEHEGFQTRLAYNYRSDYLASENEKRVLNFSDNYRAARGQLDFSASYDFSEDLTVVANATNLTGEPSRFENEFGNAWQYTEADRRFSIGARYKF